MEAWRKALKELVLLIGPCNASTAIEAEHRAETVRAAFRAVRKRAHAREQVLRQMLYNMYESEFNVSKKETDEDIEGELKGVK